MKEIRLDKNFGSILIAVPHQDDELLLSAGIVKQAVRFGLTVTVVMVTNGDYGDKDGSVGRARLSETLKGLALLGLDEKHVEFLGYADTGMEKEKSFLYHLWESEDEEKIVVSHCAEETYGLDSHPEFHWKRWGAHAPYCRKSLESDLSEILDTYEPQNVFTTSVYDSHGDHAALYLFVMAALKKRKAEGKNVPELYTGIVHSIAGDDTWPLREEEVNVYSCPSDFEKTSDLKWEERISFPVPEEMLLEDRSKNLKYQAIEKHETALKPDAVDYLRSFVKSEELFFKIQL